jgi:hypothetical protein
MIFYKDNLTKQDKCWITKEELLNRIISYNHNIYLKQNSLREKYLDIKKIAEQILESLNR